MSERIIMPYGELEARFREQMAEIEILRAAGHAAFLAMCDQRDTPDAEAFQDAIDALGLVLN